MVMDRILSNKLMVIVGVVNCYIDIFVVCVIMSLRVWLSVMKVVIVLKRIVNGMICFNRSGICKMEIVVMCMIENFLWLLFW